MKNLSLHISVATLVVLLLSAHIMHAQTLQPGIVEEYQEEAPKIPLPNVEIVANNAGSTMSDKNGEFILDFKTSQPGDRILFSKIEKQGYDLFNIEALEQRFISRNGAPLILVMCKKENFKKIRDNYNAIASQSYAEQQKNELDLLAKERNEGKITEEDYFKKKEEIENFYQEQLENISVYVDKFSRIDLSELSNQERQIIKMVREGNIRDAISAYEEHAYINQFIRECEDITKLKETKQKLVEIRNAKLQARDSIYMSIKRQADTYMLAGGKVNVKKAQTLLRDCALSDTLNFDAVYSYAYFAQQQRDYKEAERFYLICTKSVTDEVLLAKIYVNLGAVYAQSYQFQKAEAALASAYKSYELLTLLSKKYLLDLAICQANMGSMYVVAKNFTKAEYYLLEADKIYAKLYQKIPQYIKHHYAINLMNIGICSREKNEFDKSELAYQQSLLLYKELVNEVSRKYLSNVAICQLNMGMLYYFFNDYAKAEQSFNQAKENILICQQNNPYAYVLELASIYDGLGLVYGVTNRQKESVELYKIAIKLYEKQNKDFLEIHKYDYAKVWANLGRQYVVMQQYDEAIKCLEKACDLYKNSPQSSNEAFKLEMAELHFNLAESYYLKEDYSKAKSIYMSVESSLASYADGINNNEKLLLATVREKLGLILLEEAPEQSEQYLLFSLKVLKDAYLISPDEYRLDYAFCLLGLVTIYKNSLETNSEALEKLINILPSAYKQWKILYKASPESYKSAYEHIEGLMEALNLSL